MPRGYTTLCPFSFLFSFVPSILISFLSRREPDLTMRTLRLNQNSELVVVAGLRVVRRQVYYYICIVSSDPPFYR